MKLGGRQMEEKYRDLKKGERGAIISIIAYICLSLLKLLIGYTANSEALKADGLNNATDIIASVAVLIGLKLSQKPPDKNHPYGHWKAETVASMIASFIMGVVGIQVLVDAFFSVFNGIKESPDMISAWTGIFSAVVMYLVYRYNKNLGKKINSQAVLAASKDNLSDAMVSIGTTVGIIGSQFNLPWLDPLTAVIIGILICKTAWEIFRDSSHILTDGFDEKQIETYKKAVLTLWGVKGVKAIKARNYGNNSVVDVVILVNSNLDIRNAHDISTRVEDVLKNNFDVFDVHVHIEPN
jgi:cation diffusion facilitator family transporter